MPTTMQLALARAIGVELSATAPEENAFDDPRRIVLTIEKVRFTLRELMDGSPIPIGDIDQDVLDKALSGLDLRKRHYTDREGILYFEKPLRPGQKGRNSPKMIERLGYSSPSQEVVRDIDRELVVVLKGEKDLFTTEAGTIKHMRNLLLRLLADDSMRGFLQKEKSGSFKYIGRINDALDQKRADISLESESREYYERITTALGFSQLDHMVVRALSWEWKDRPIYRSHPYACRCWVIIPCIFGLTKN